MVVVLEWLSAGLTTVRCMQILYRRSKSEILPKNSAYKEVLSEGMHLLLLDPSLLTLLVFRYTLPWVRSPPVSVNMVVLTWFISAESSLVSLSVRSSFDTYVILQLCVTVSNILSSESSCKDLSDCLSPL
jgi:hypothetical protein